ncbi:MAG: hydrogen peroxide-inducible genes activator [Parvularculaceae bacterium]|jgi:LysR family hydrogen peroxide-inducible transcriptional activator|nr:hydrogen peroxide-inducible genes activator [Parvularculaceae bacterium]
MIPLPTVRQLQFFHALARRKSFSKAAEDCLVSQSTLSSAIKELEGVLRCQLVDRSTKAFALTPSGEAVVARAERILALTEDLARSAAARQPLEGQFHLGVIPTVAPFLLPAAAPKLRAAFPRLELYLREDLTANLVDRLSAGLLDAAVLAFPYDVRGAEVIDLGEDCFYFAARPDHPHAAKKAMSLDDLSGETLLLLEDGHCLRDHAIDACKLARGATAAGFAATSLFTLTQMALSGLGATLLPEMAVNAGLAKTSGLKAVPFADPAPSRRIGLAWRRSSGRREEAEALAGVLRGAMKRTG